MAVEKFSALDPVGLKTLVREIFSIIKTNFVQKTDMQDSVLTELVKFSFKIKDEDGCLYLQFPDDANPDLVDQAIQEWKKKQLLGAIQDAHDKLHPAE